MLAAALALEPDDRTQSAAELGRALAAVRAAHPERGAPSVRIDDRYELIGLAGTGAKADAHLAVHRGTGHDVILKSLRSEAPDDVLRFAREAQILRTFDHPALPRFYDYALAAKPPYIAMAHAPGEPAVRSCSPPRLKPAEVAAVGLELAQVLAVLHARGVLHRDINANNVLIDARGAVTLLDFGCAELGDKFYEAPAGERRYWTPPESRVTIPDGGIGRLPWSAPEVREGRGWSDRSDVYSLGHLLFRLLTGKVPEKGADPPTSPLTAASTCPEELASAVTAALCPDPGDRPSATQFARMLEDALETEEEALARLLTKPIPAGRAALQLVPDPPHTPDRTGHMLPENGSEPPARPLPEPQAAETTARILEAARPSRAWAWSGVAGALIAIFVGLRWWSVRQAPLEPGVVRTAEDVPAAAAAPQQPARASTPALLAATDRSLPTMQDALAGATPGLRRCSALAGELLFVEFTTAAESDRFASVVSSSSLQEVDRCVRAAIASIRFQPRDPEKFTQEYPP